MTDRARRIAFVSPDQNLGEAITRTIGEGFVVTTNPFAAYSDLQEVLRWAEVILLDVRPGDSGSSRAAYSLLDEIRKDPANPPVVALCDAGDHQAIFEALHHGAHDCLTSPPNMVEVRFILQRTQRYSEAEKELQRLRLRERGAGSLHGLIGSSSVMLEIFETAKRIASCDVNVLISGDTGTGKELLAKAIHYLGSRSEGPLVAFSCANLPETLVEDELFGHEKGAFTGAMFSRLGRVEAANHGTLFLDEVGDLSLGLQPKLLRVLQEKSIERLGSNRTISVDMRLISATNRNLAEMVKQGKFREDLYYRLNVVELHLPALRERRDDILLLAQHCLQTALRQHAKRAKHFSPQVIQVFEQYAWPGNVRELENVVQRAVVLSDGPRVELAHLPAALRNIWNGSPEGAARTGESATRRSYEEEVRRFKRNLVVRTLSECGWRKSEAAKVLGVARGYLHRLINQLDIHREGDQAAMLREEADLPAGPVM